MAVWTTAYINNLPDSSFLYIEPGGSKDAEGKTTPRSLRHFPVKDASGAVDMPHLRNALSRIPQSSLSPAIKARLTSKAQGMMPSNRSRELDTFWRAGNLDTVDLQRSARGNPILSGELALFNQWTEIRSPIEGHFMERLTPSVFKKTIAERAKSLRVLFQHGRDAITGDKPLGKIIDLPNDGKSQRYNVELFNVGYVNELLPALEAGQYGSSFSARDIRSTEVSRPERSDANPQGLPEVTREELMLREFGPVTFPAYENTTAGLRSVTDDFLQPGLRDLLGALGWTPPVLRAETLEPQDEPESESEPEEEQVGSYSEEVSTPPDDEPPHSGEEANESREEIPSWQLRR